MTHSVEQRKVIEDSPNSENSSFSNLVKPAADSKPSGKGDSNMSRAQMTNASVAGKCFQHLELFWMKGHQWGKKLINSMMLL